MSKSNTKKNTHADKLAARLGISREEVDRAIENLLDGDGSVYRRVIALPLHGSMQYENLPKEAQAAARRIARRTGETPSEVARRTARAFCVRGAVYRERDIMPEGERTTIARATAAQAARDMLAGCRGYKDIHIELAERIEAFRHMACDIGDMSDAADMADALALILRGLADGEAESGEAESKKAVALSIPRATPAQTRRVVKRLAKERGCTEAQVIEQEMQAHERLSRY